MSSSLPIGALPASAIVPTTVLNLRARRRRTSRCAA